MKTSGASRLQPERAASYFYWLLSTVYFLPHFTHSSVTADSTLTGTALTYSSPAAHITPSTTRANSSAPSSGHSTTTSSCTTLTTFASVPFRRSCSSRSARLMMSAELLCVIIPLAMNCSLAESTTSYISTHSSVHSTDLTR